MVKCESDANFGDWVDPDIVYYYEQDGGTQSYDKELESDFRRFFETEWQNPRYDDMRESWDYLIYSDSPHTRVLAKTALWCAAQKRRREYAEEDKRLANG